MPGSGLLIGTQITRKPIRLFIYLLVLLTAVLLSGCSLAEDVTPPPGYREPTAPPQAATVGAAVPVSAPDLNAGAGIYAQKCEPCHGADGLGNGPQASQLPNPAAPIGSPVLARASRPADWYNVITQGRFDRFMPGFSQSLSDAQRWDVLGYVYSLSVPADTLQQGAQVFQDQCAGCHGAGGDGDGTQSTQGRLNDLTDPAWQSSQSESDIFQVVSNGNSPGMPAFSGKLSDDQRWAVTGYIRSLAASSRPLTSAVQTPAGQEALASSQTPKAAAPGVTVVNPQGTPLANATAESASVGSITGQISNGSGGSVPAGIQVTLHGYDQSVQEVLTQTTSTDKSGRYTFPRVDLSSAHSIMVSADYGGTTFHSDIVQGQAGSQPVNVPLTVYEATTDLTNLSVDRMHVFFDFSNPGVVQVVQLYVITNSGN